MKLYLLKDYEEVSRKTADIVIDLVKAKPDMLFCLPAGGSPIRMYELLVEAYRQGRVDFSRMVTYDMDEYVGIGPQDPNSYAHFMQEHFLRYVDVDPANVHYPDGLAADLDAMCARYSQDMLDAGGIDLAITGIGDDGHVAFNEPDDYLLPRTHAVRLKESTVKANARFFSDISQVPPMACSIGMEDIMRSRTFLIIASGAHKAPMVEKMFSSDHIDPHFPVSFCRMHPNAIFIIDQPAAGSLDRQALAPYLAD